MLHHGVFEWLKNYAAFFQIFRNDIAFDELVVREDHPAREFIEPAGIFQNVFPIVFRKRCADLKRCEVEKSNICKSPRLIFTRWVWQPFKFLPGSGLLVPKPVRKFARLDAAGEN